MSIFLARWAAPHIGIRYSRFCQRIRRARTCSWCPILVVARNWATACSLPTTTCGRRRALCAQTDPEAFFPEKGGSTREAKRICQGCEVKDECLEYALANDERFGIWGGLSERERRRLKRGII